MAFVKATKKEAKARIAVVGVTGGGKTFSGLRMAHAIAAWCKRNGGSGKVAVIDSERKSASKYSGEVNPDGGNFEFDVNELDNHHPGTYMQAIEEAEAGGYDVLVIDSLSHAWMGKEGALEQVDNAARRGSNSFAAWRDVTPLHNKLVDKILNAKVHIIATLRAKMEYAVEKNEKTNKTEIKKLGLAPVMRDGIEYEFDITGDIDVHHYFAVSKTRCAALDQKVFEKPGKEFAESIMRWLTEGAKPLSVVYAEEAEAMRGQAQEMAKAIDKLTGTDWRAKFDPYLASLGDDHGKLKGCLDMLKQKKEIAEKEAAAKALAEAGLGDDNSGKAA